VASTDERDWQELVVRHVGVTDWEVLELGDALDVVGPIAGEAIRRHGPLSPPNAHFMLPLAERARGGTLLTGVDGDSVLGGWRWSRLGELARGAARPRPRDLITLGHFASPLAMQRAVASRISPLAFPWLAPRAARTIEALRAREQLVQPRRFDRYVEWLRRRRLLVVFRRQMDLLGADAGARIVHPLLDDRFLAAYAAEGGWRGFGDRTATLGALFADVLPDALISRPTKATFGGVFMGEHARAFAARWDGGGLDPDLVDADALRADWNGPAISFRSTTLMQWLWLREQAP
jgi:asparagine synthase (glutamine-hydrolysing)